MIVHLADNDYWTKCEFRLGAFWSTQTSRMTKIRAWMRSIRRRVACFPGQVVAGVSMSENRASSVRWRRDISRRIGRWRSRIGWRARRRIYRGPQNRPGCNARSDAAPTRSAVVIAIAAAASVDIHVPVRGDIGVAVRIRVHIPIRGRVAIARICRVTMEVVAIEATALSAPSPTTLAATSAATSAALDQDVAAFTGLS